MSTHLETIKSTESFALLVSTGDTDEHSAKEANDEEDWSEVITEAMIPAALTVSLHEKNNDTEAEYDGENPHSSGDHSVFEFNQADHVSNIETLKKINPEDAKSMI